MNLTQEQKRVKLAEACGVELMTPGWIPSYNDPDNIGCHPVAEPIDPPDYFNDRNAIPELMTLLKTSEQRNTYINLLHDWCESEDQPDLDFEWLNSPPEKCADAVGVTLNLWEAGE